MELEYLYEFTVIAQLESFSRAAEELCISQSSLSKHVLALERELGVSLLQRGSRRVTLTPTGAKIMPMAREISRLKDGIRAAAEEQTRREKGTLALASIPVMAQYNITGLLADFRREHPKVALEITECEQQELRELLEKGTCQIAFARRGLEDWEDLESLEFCRDELVAVAPLDHPLSKRDRIEPEVLKGEPLLFLDQQTGFHHLYTALCRGAGFVPNIAYTGRRPENIIELAAQGMGVALVMGRHVRYLDHPGVKAIPFAPAVDSAVCLIRRKDRALSELPKAFWEFVEQRAEE